MRQRMTWGRKASAHPAYPDEGPASPAYPGADPEADAYENGDPSSWAEDPRKGPYAQSAHPSYPDEGPASPAYNKQASLERKAAKCIRIASAMLGRTASVRQIEDQALVLMDLDNRAITATLSRLAGEEAEDEEEAPKAESKKKAAWGEHEQDLLESMMAEEGMMGEFEDEIAESEHDLLESMMAEEGMMPEAEADHMAESEDEVLESMLGDDFGGSEDPMGVVDVEMTPDERFLMAKLFGGKKAGEEEAEDEAPEAPKAEKKASFRPQPRKPANGVTRLGGGVTKEASASNDLSKLWDSAPDVSKYF